MLKSMVRRLADRLAAERLRAAEEKLAHLERFYDGKLATSREQIATLARRVEALRSEADRLEELLRAHQQQAAQLELGLAAAPRYEFGSLGPVEESWSRRWQEDRPRVVLFAVQDFGGSFYAWADAVNRSTDWAARLVVIRRHRFGYKNDILYGAPALLPDSAHTLLEQADVFHVKDECGFMDGRNGLPPDLLARHGKPTVFTQYGGLARAYQDEPTYREHVQSFDAVVSITPDLCFPWLDEVAYVPHAVDASLIAPTWRSDSRLLGHSPSTREASDGDAYAAHRKGTSDFELAVERLRRDIDVEVDIIRGVPHDECLDRKARLSLFFDQSGNSDPSLGPQRVVGWYGNSGLEAAVRGIPTVAHLSDRAFEGARRGGHEIRDRCRILNTGQGPDALEKVLRSYFALHPTERAELSRNTRRWVEEFHDSTVVGPQLANLYRSVSRR